MADYQTILSETDAGVAVIRLNRPERRNAFTTEMLTELADAFARADADPAVRAVVVTGAGKTFCAGQDLAAFTQLAGPGAVREIIERYYKPMILGLCSLSKPVLAAVNGVAAGAGASLALACDLRILADDASLLQAFSTIGLVPDAGSTWFLVRAVGYGRAFEMAATGERVPATRCLELGLANRVVPAADLLPAALAWAHQLAARPTVALGLTKQALLYALEHGLEQTLDREAALQAMAVQTADHQEGVRAFLEKRAPVFQGR